MPSDRPGVRSFPSLIDVGRQAKAQTRPDASQLAPARNEAIRSLQGTDHGASARDGDLLVATQAILDLLAERLYYPLVLLEGAVRQWGDDQPRETGRRVLIELAEAGQVEFLTCTIENPRGDPIPLEDGLAAIRGETDWDLRLPSMTVALTDRGRDHYSISLRLPDLPWPGAAEPLPDDIGTAQAD